MADLYYSLTRVQNCILKQFSVLNKSSGSMKLIPVYILIFTLKVLTHQSRKMRNKINNLSLLCLFKKPQKVVLIFFSNCQENICAVIFFNKAANFKHATLLKKKPWHRCFPLNFANVLRTALT